MFGYMTKTKFQMWVGLAAILASSSAFAGQSVEWHVQKEVRYPLSQANKLKTTYFVDESSGEVTIHTSFRQIDLENGRREYLGFEETSISGLALSPSKSEIVFTVGSEGQATSTVTCARLTKKKMIFGMSLMIAPTGACLISSEFIRGGDRYGDLDVGFKAEF